MLRLTPILLIIAYALVSYHFSAWRTRRMLAERSQPLTDPSLTRLVERLAAALGVAQIKVMVFEVEAINGLAAPDGQIYLTRGFLNRKMRGEVSAEELASVIAHELGHVALGHARRRMIDFAGQNVAFVVLSAVLNRIVPGLGGMLVGALSRLLAAGLSRRDEYAADAYATALLIRAGIGTAPQKALFAKLEALTQTAGRGAPLWLQSHPPAAERIAAITANEARWRADQG